MRGKHQDLGNVICQRPKTDRQCLGPVSLIGAGDSSVWTPVGVCVDSERQKETGRPCMERPSVWAQTQIHNPRTFLFLFPKAPAYALKEQ